jgi:hypothetical protein
MEAPGTARQVTYKAMRLHGTATGGVATFAPGELAAWVRRRYEAGWRRLSVIDCTTGVQVGWIGRHPDTGRRTWLADPHYTGDRSR